MTNQNNANAQATNAQAQDASTQHQATQNQGAVAHKRTELVFIVDRSGSMYGLEKDTIGGLNAVLKKNRELDGEVTVSTVLFDDVTEVLHDRLPINKVADLTEKDYETRGCTALLDAVGGSIRHIERVQKYMPDEYKADKVIFVITTDGMENSSSEYNYPTVKKAIERKTEEGWEFMFLGANIDAAAEAGRLGIAADRAVEYISDGKGTRVMHAAVAEATCCMRETTGRIGGSWADGIRADVRSRKHRRH